MYSIVKTGGKQYRVEEGQTLLIERLPADEGAEVTLQPLLYVDGDDVLDGDDLVNVTVQATVVAHERGPKLRIVKFKPKRGYKRRTGHRQELTRIRIASIKRSESKPTQRAESKPARSAAAKKKEPEAAVAAAPEETQDGT